MLSSNRFYSVVQASTKESWKIALISLAIIGIGLMTVYFSPTEFIFGLLGMETVNGCPLFTLAGVPCPLCGMGRVISSISDFHFARTFYYNPLGLIFLVIFNLLLFIILVLSLFMRKIVLTKTSAGLWYIPMLFVIIMWILNILYGHHG
ncbi:MAG: DUF2752 domain-containing protein [Chlorobi bacterium]|nr:DUF2752 domain-containing protein [Chlorobiota bacterium]MCI0716308.1 DUF2752 domain-containing protein [Chlorobiota bacterium]